MGKHWLSSMVALEEDLAYSSAGISLGTGGGVSEMFEDPSR